MRRPLAVLLAAVLAAGALASCGGSDSADDKACARWSAVTARGPVQDDEQTRADVQAIIDLGPSPAIEAPATAVQVALADGLDPTFTANRLTAACESR